MHPNNLDIIAPALGYPTPSEAHAFGAATWLWTHSVEHMRMPLHELQRRLAPPIQLHQYILVAETLDGVSRLVGYIGWANLSADAESRYVDNPAGGLQIADWNSGDRMWITEIFAPFGHTPILVRLAQNLLASSCMRSLYHRGNERGLRVLYFRGQKIQKNKPMHGGKSVLSWLCHDRSNGTFRCRFF